MDPPRGSQQPLSGVRDGYDRWALVYDHDANPLPALRPSGRAVVSAMHPAMFLRGSRARFTDPDSGAIVAPGSIHYRFGEVVMAAVSAGFAPLGIGEHAPDPGFARRYPRAERYVGWPMLLVLVLRPAPTPAP